MTHTPAYQQEVKVEDRNLQTDEGQNSPPGVLVAQEEALDV